MVSLAKRLKWDFSAFTWQHLLFVHVEEASVMSKKWLKFLFQGIFVSSAIRCSIPYVFPSVGFSRPFVLMKKWNHLFDFLFAYFFSTAPSPIDPVLTVQPDHCYIFFSLKSTFKNYFINYHNIIHLSLVRRIRQTLKTKPLIMLLYNYNLLIQKIPIQQP